MCWAARTFYIFIYLILMIILGNRYYYKPIIQMREKEA